MSIANHSLLIQDACKSNFASKIGYKSVPKSKNENLQKLFDVQEVVGFSSPINLRILHQKLVIYSLVKSESHHDWPANKKTDIAKFYSLWIELRIFTQLIKCENHLWKYKQQASVKIYKDQIWNSLAYIRPMDQKQALKSKQRSQIVDWLLIYSPYHIDSATLNSNWYLSWSEHLNVTRIATHGSSNPPLLHVNQFDNLCFLTRFEVSKDDKFG